MEVIEIVLKIYKYNRLITSMNKLINNLVNKILIIQQNDYRLGDIIFKKGQRWLYSGNQILTNEKYNGSILKSYLEQNGLRNEINLNKFLDITEEYNKTKNLSTPNDNELVLHLRLGDYVEFIGILNKPYIRLIREYIKNNNNINKLTIVTAFSYGTWTKESLHLKRKGTPMWICTQEIQNINIQKMKVLIKKIYNNFPNLIVDIVSNSDIDKDICYCVNSKYFINDNGGFSLLMKKLNNLKNQKSYL
jgi:hypothetical protein